MNYRRGVARLFTVIALVWSLGWGWTAYDAERQSNQLGEQTAQAQVSYGQEKGIWALGEDEQIDIMRGKWIAQLKRRDSAIKMGLGGLASMAALYFAGLWVLRGFNRG